MDEMKKCPNCGTIQNPSRQTCVDCGKVLPEANEEFANELGMMADSSLDGRMDWNDRRSAFYHAKKYFFIAAIALIITNIVLIAIYHDTNDGSALVLSILLALATLLFCVFPRQISYFLHSRRFYRPVYTPPELDYVDSADRIFMLILVTVSLVAAISATGYFVYRKPPIQTMDSYANVNIGDPMTSYDTMFIDYN